jgi:hypothetical protein
MEASTSELHFSVVVTRLGPALFPNDWIGGLSAREIWQVDRGGMLPIGMMTSYDRQDAMGHSNDPEYKEALKKYDFMLWQRKEVKSWLVRQRVEIVDRGSFDVVNAQQFEAAFARAFPELASSTTIAHEQSAGQKTASGRGVASTATVRRSFAEFTDACRRDGVRITEEATRQAMRAKLDRAPCGGVCACGYARHSGGKPD